jgi:hypothetical protein
MGSASHDGASDHAPDASKSNSLSPAKPVTGDADRRASHPSFETLVSNTQTETGCNVPPAWYTETIAPRRGGSGLPKYVTNVARAKLGVMIPESLRIDKLGQSSVFSGAQREHALSVKETSNAQEDGREKRLTEESFSLHRRGVPPIVKCCRF